MTERVSYFDVLRGLAIVGVVATHASSVGAFRIDTLDFYINIFWRNIWNFCVPLFICISGYFLAKKTFLEINDYKSFVQKQIPRVYSPMLFWSFVWFLLAIAKNASINSEFLKLLTFQSSTPYYFIALIIQYYLLLPVLKRYANFQGLVCSVVISIGSTLIIFYVRYYAAIDLPLIIYGGNFLTWIMFFLLGLYIGAGNNIKISNAILLINIVFFYLLSCFETYWLVELFNKPKDAVTAIKFSSFIYSFSLIIYLFQNKDILYSKVLKKLGVNSFGIYLIHMFMLNIEFRVLHKVFPDLNSASFFYQTALTLLVVFSSLIGILIVNKFISKKLSSLIGFN